MFKIIYNLFLPVGFLFFLPSFLYKYRNRPGWKATFAERFGRFTPERLKELESSRGAIWIHAVSVGESVVALSMVRRYMELYPGRKFVLSTTTTTAQELARREAPPEVPVIFCPMDFIWMVRSTLNALKPSKLVIFETEIWPNLVNECVKRQIPVALVNGRMSDHSVRGYRRLKCFFGPLLRKFALISVQSQADAGRFSSVSPEAAVMVSGNMKFDQRAPATPGDPGLDEYFGAGERLVLLGASTHSGEEALLADEFINLKPHYPNLKLVLVPRHAERGNDVAAMLKEKNLGFAMRSSGAVSGENIDVLLADTTGEMLKFMNAADIVVMGKSLAGHDQGHNLIEPALLKKPVVTGAVLRNFRYLLEVLQAENAVVTVSGEGELFTELRRLLDSAALRAELGERANQAIAKHAGAVERTITALERI